MWSREYMKLTLDERKEYDWKILVMYDRRKNGR